MYFQSSQLLLSFILKEGAYPAPAVLPFAKCKAVATNSSVVVTSIAARLMAFMYGKDYT